MDKLKVGIIGAGGIIAKMHLPDLANNDAFQVALIAGRSEPRLKLLCEKFGIPRWTHNYEDVIADNSIDACVIATPHALHVSWGLKAIAAGKHVLMQKPLCDTMKDADAFVAAAGKTKRTVMCLPHFGAPIYELNRLIRDGAIGKVTGARCRTSHGGPEMYYAGVRDFFGEADKDLWFFDAKRAGVGALFDMGVYSVAQLVAVLGSARRVTGFTATLDKPTTLEDAATLVLQMESGAPATAETSWCDPVSTNELSVHGTKGKFTMPGMDGSQITRWTPMSYTHEGVPAKSEPLAVGAGVGGMHEHFLNCIRRGAQPPLSNAHAARHVTEIMLAGLESSRTGRAVEIKSRVCP